MEGKRDFDRKADECVRKLAYTLEGHMKRRAPVLTGRLRASIKTTFGKLRYGAFVGPHTNYAEAMEKKYGYIWKGVEATDREAQKIADQVFGRWMVQDR